MRLPAKCLAVLWMAALAAPAREASAYVINKDDVLTWPQAPADVFGCFLERQFGYKDPRFDCSLKGYKNTGNPCADTKAYYEGPAFPQAQAAAVHKALRSVDLAWEHGELQAATFVLNKKLPSEKVRRLFHLPKLAYLPRPNVLQYDIQDCGKDSVCLLLLGFEHVGAGEADCAQAGSAGEEQALPAWALERFAKRLGKTHVRSSRVQPVELLGDFDGDGRADAALLVRGKGDGTLGIAVLHASGGEHLLGAGRRFGELGPDWAWMDSWVLHPAGKPLPDYGQEPPKLLGDALMVDGGPAPGLILYFDGKTYRGYQPGD